MDIGLLVLRTFVGVAFAMHGTQKLFGRKFLGMFGGYGLAGTAGFVGSLGYRNPRMAALGAGLVETTAGVMLVTGFLTPLAAAAIIGMMLNAAIAVNRPRGFIGGYELDAAYGVTALAIAFTGAGRYSVDAAAGWNLSGTTWGLVAAAIGVAIGGLVLATRTPPAAEPVEDAGERRAA